jgi:hypothetical protein
MGSVSYLFSVWDIRKEFYILNQLFYNILMLLRVQEDFSKHTIRFWVTNGMLQNAETWAEFHDP